MTSDIGFEIYGGRLNESVKNVEHVYKMSTFGQIYYGIIK